MVKYDNKTLKILKQVKYSKICTTLSLDDPIISESN